MQDILLALCGVGPVIVPLFVGLQRGRGGDGFDIAFVPSHAGAAEPLADLFAEAFHRSAGDGPPLPLVSRVIQMPGVALEEADERVQRLGRLVPPAGALQAAGGLPAAVLPQPPAPLLGPLPGPLRALAVQRPSRLMDVLAYVPDVVDVRGVGWVRRIRPTPCPPTPAAAASGR